ncbi:uncharacterized protein METZ01_LOCUS298082 [marine metagenome]|uniref:Uncharacterized protein n=1 Tax=marine metagenome TaxID=408172 RepID=A0A382M9G5_9ZZZZ
MEMKLDIDYILHDARAFFGAGRLSSHAGGSSADDASLNTRQFSEIQAQGLYKTSFGPKP